MTNYEISQMVSRFLQWKLPADFQPDAGISFKPEFNEHTAHPMRHEPVGTNLLNAAQAEEMVRFMLAPTTSWASPTLDRAYQEVYKLRRDLAQPRESGIDEALRAALDAIELADTEIAGVAA